MCSCVLLRVSNEKYNDLFWVDYYEKDTHSLVDRSAEAP